MKFEVDAALVEPVIRSHIEAAIVGALGDPTAIIRQAVQVVLSRKVSHTGGVSQYSSENKHDLIEVLAGNAIREAVDKAVRTMVETMKPQIQEHIEEHMRRSPKKTAAAILSAFSGSVAEKAYRMHVDFRFEPGRD